MVKDTEVTVPMESAMDDAIVDQLGYGDSKAEFIREAIRQRLVEKEGVDVSELEPGETDGGQITLAGD